MAAHTEFSTDTVKRLKRAGRNREIVDVCKLNLPVSGAFSEMAVALRKLIRERRKDKKRYNDVLRQLYHAAVWHNFFSDFDALCLMEQADSCRLATRFIPRIKCDYNLIGYEHLDMLGVNDVKWIVASWGEPNTHGTARSINQALHARAVARYKLEKERELRSAGRLFGDQQLKLTDPGFEESEHIEPEDLENNARDQTAPARHNRFNKRLAMGGIVAAAVLIITLLILNT